MAVIPTKQLFSEYFAEFRKTHKSTDRFVKQADRPDLYEYEKKIGKQLVDMDIDELYGMIRYFSEGKMSGARSAVSFSTYQSMASMYKHITDYYITHHEVVINRWHDPRMQGSEAYKNIIQDKTPFDKATMDNIMAKCRKYYNEERADLCELTMLLYYDGFAEAKEIAQMREGDIDFSRRTVALPGRTVHLGERTMRLLVKNHDSDTIGAHRQEVTMASWHGGYFKLPVRKRDIPGLDKRSLWEIQSKINRAILVFVRQRFQVDINYRLLFLLGFYDKSVQKYGKERVEKMIFSVRDNSDSNNLYEDAREYGLNFNTPSAMKRALKEFLRSV